MTSGHLGVKDRILQSPYKHLHSIHIFQEGQRILVMNGAHQQQLQEMNKTRLITTDNNFKAAERLVNYLIPKMLT